ncbi:MAG: hypothetical protein HYY66_01610 [Candidatus Tectomicrobia bacterium]|nr:hypothetical protein [Candidatus Tectomicrobia bacterium]
MFSAEHLKKRVQNPAGSWVKNRKSLGTADIERCELKIKGLGGLINSLHVRRNKYEAHFDGKYKRDFSRLANDSPITWGDLDSVVEVVHDVFNEFSIAFDGSQHGLQAGNIDDVNWLLEIVHRYLQLRDGGMEEL